MKRSRGKGKNRIVAYLGYPILFFALTALLYLAGGKLLVNMIVDDFKLAAIQGAPEYTYDDRNQMGTPKKDGILKMGEVKLPLVGDQFGQISCDAIGLKAPLYYGDTEKTLTNGIGVYIGSSLPGQGSTILAGGHDTTFCAPLDAIAEDHILTVHTTYGEYTYKVTATKVADLLEDSAYHLENTKETLILYTCYPFGEVNSNRTKRFYVYAEKTSGPTIQEE